ncbi:MAG TPA: GNAT family protein [Hyphomicrobiaceae bacterium]|nr:GNAT family protein [Hyphomicrobiaceae bacterium]
MKHFISNSIPNTLGQPIGKPVPDFTPPPRPAREKLAGRTCWLEPLNAAAHADDLFSANALDVTDAGWTYSAVGPYANAEEYRRWADQAEVSEDPLYFAIMDPATGKPAGTATYMRIDPAQAVIEVGSIKYSPLLQKKTAATEAMYLMMAHAFALGYRRYEWKCDSHNQPSRDAAIRLGFQFEGIFRQAMVYKGRNRDTTWYSIIDTEWPTLKAAYETWLSPENFAPDGRQRQRLSDLTAAARKSLVSLAR